MRYLTARQVLYLHFRIIETTGGSHGIRDLGLLLAALGRPQGTFSGHDLYPSLTSKSAALLESLALNHPFVDGNKRTAIASAGLLLRMNGLNLIAGNSELEDFVVGVVVDRPSTDAIALWLDERTRPVDDPA